MTVLFGYEDLSNADSVNAVVAANVSNSKGWIRRGYPAISMSAVPWQLNDSSERSWNFLIHCWDMLDSQLKAYEETKCRLYIDVSLEVVNSWIDYLNSDKPENLSPMLWYDMAVGIRSYRLGFLIDVLAAEKFCDDAQIQKLYTVLEAHREYLADEMNIVFHNNHGLYQVAGQIAMGRRFAHCSIEMATAFQLGKDRLNFMLEQQFAADGIHREHSPDYHRMVYETVKALIDSGLVEDQYTIDHARKIESSLSWFVLPDQHIVNFGDSDNRLMKRKPEVARRKWQTPEMQYVVTAGEVGALPEACAMQFAEGGYYVVRKAAANKVFSDTSYLAQMAAFHSRAHKHADDLSFVWTDRGFNLLVDAGRFGYLGKADPGSELWLDGHWYADPKRVYCESTRAHNTLEFNGKNYPRKSSKPYGSAIKRSYEITNELYAVETECKHFGSIRRNRLLVFKPAQWLIVLDWFHDNNGENQQVKQWFHLDKGLSLYADKNGYIVPLPVPTEPLRIVSLLAEPIVSRPYVGETTPALQGWWSGQERELLPNSAFNFELNEVQTGNFATLFSFSGVITTDTDWSKVNLTGRKGQLRWIDERGKHEVRFKRPEIGDLVVNYQSPESVLDFPQHIDIK